MPWISCKCMRTHRCAYTYASIRAHTHTHKTIHHWWVKIAHHFSLCRQTASFSLIIKSHQVILLYPKILQLNSQQPFSNFKHPICLQNSSKHLHSYIIQSILHFYVVKSHTINIISHSPLLSCMYISNVLHVMND